MKIGVSLAALALLALAGPVFANPCPPGDPPTNCAPPVGTTVFDLNGQAIPHTYTEYTANFTAVGSSTVLAFAFREDPAFWSLDDVSVVAHGGSTNIVSDGDFSNTTLSPWVYTNVYGVDDANGVLDSGCGRSGGNCWYDGAVQAYDGLNQTISTVTGQQYTLTFWLTDNSSLTTAQQLSTNGNVSSPGGNGADVLVYAGTGAPVEGGGTAVPEIDPASIGSALTLLFGALVVLKGRKARGPA
jgi:hypothetical protein